MRKKYVGIIVLSLVLISLVVFTVSGYTSSSSNVADKYSISSENILPNNRQVFLYNNDLIFLSCNDNTTLLSSFHLENKVSSNIYSFDGCYSTASLNNNILNVVFRSDNSIIFSYDLKENHISSKISVPTNISCKENYCVDNYNNHYVIDGNSVVCFDKLGIYLCNYNLEGNLKSVLSTPDNSKIYAITDDTFYLLDDGNAVSQEINLNNKMIKFVSNNEFVDESGALYTSLDGNWIFSYNTASTLNTVSCCYDNVNEVSNDKIYSLDSSGSILGEYAINSPSDVLLNSSSQLVSISGTNSNDFVVEVVPIDSIGEVTLEYFNQKSNVFVSSPLPGTNYYDDIKDLSSWYVIIDNNQLSTSLRGIPYVTIKNDKSGDIYTKTINNGLTISEDGATLYFTAPDNIEDTSFTIQIINISTIYGNPAQIEYNISVLGGDVPTPDVPTNIQSDVYNIGNGIISNVTPGTTSSQLINNLNCSGEISIISSNGQAVNSGKVGTGDTVYLTSNGAVVDSDTIVIYGDINGDGNINSSDIKLAYDNSIGRQSINKYAVMAYDVNHDGQNNNIDLVSINKCCNNNYCILQDYHN